VNQNQSDTTRSRCACMLSTSRFSDQESHRNPQILGKTKQRLALNGNRCFRMCAKTRALRRITGNFNMWVKSPSGSAARPVDPDINRPSAFGFGIPKMTRYLVLFFVQVASWCTLATTPPYSRWLSSIRRTREPLKGVVASQIHRSSARNRPGQASIRQRVQ
jgi:hypothetical protein